MDMQLRSRILDRLAALGLSVRGASLTAGLSESAIKDILAGKNASPRMETLVKIAGALQVDPAWLAFGQSDAATSSDDALQPISNARGFSMAPVDGSVQAGNWIEVDVYGEGETAEMISAPRDPDFPYARQVAYRVGGDSMNKAEPRPIKDGDIIVCVSFEDTGLTPATGMKVVVQRTKYDGALRERSVKDLVMFPDRAEFHPRSDNPAHKTIVVPIDTNPDDTTTVEILALVRFTFDAMPLPLPVATRIPRS